MTRAKPNLATTSEQSPKRKLPVGIRALGGRGSVMKMGLALLTGSLFMIGGCATLTNDPNQNVSFKAPGCKPHTVTCKAWNKRGTWEFGIPEVVPIRRSDDILRIECVDEQGKVHTDQVASRIGGKIVASAVFLDFGITDAITDKHREYPEQIILQICY